MLWKLKLCCFTEGALPPPPPSHPSVEDLLVRGWGDFSLQGHISLNRLPSFSSPSSILSLALLFLSLFFFCSPPRSLFPLLLTPHVQLSPSLQSLFNFRHLFLLSPPLQGHFLPFFALLSIFPSLPFLSSSSPSDPAPFQTCIIRPKHKPAQAHIWKEFGDGSFLPRRLNI